jgi:hypothetical protein
MTGPDPTLHAELESGREIFRFGYWAWDITAGLALVADQQPVPTDITVVRGIASLIRINPAQVARADLTRPLLVAPILGAGLFIIDGWHRVHRALQTDVSHLPARLLTEDDERAIRLSGG